MLALVLKAKWRCGRTSLHHMQLVMERTPNFHSIYALQDCFPYMFTHTRHSTSSICSGWVPLFARACHDIDELLGENKRGFRWISLGERFGAARLRFNFECDRDERYTRELISNIVNRTQSRTRTACMVCGARAKAFRIQGWVGTLCANHANEYS